MPNGIELEFADGAYLFALPVLQIIELQRACEKPGRSGGIFEIYGRVLAGRAKYVDNDGLEHMLALPHEGRASVEDIFETIRLALIGGGTGLVNGEEVKVGPIRAKQLVEAYCHPAPLKESWDIAAAILYALVEGYEDKKKEPQPKPARSRRVSTKPKS
jgi:hypothetical protein